MKLAVIIGATRQGRQTPKQAKWVLKSAQAIEGIDPSIIDLADYDMPFFDEPASPRYNPNREIDPSVQPWLDELSNYDAYVFVTPEYNHSIPGVLKNALDYVTAEMNRKPSAIVSHGIITKKSFAEVPPRIEYTLTKKGEDLLPILKQMASWGTKYYTGNC